MPMRHPAKYFEHLSEESAQELERHLETAASNEGLELDILAAACRKRDTDGKAAMSPSERAAYRLFRQWYLAWAEERAGGAEAVKSQRAADFAARTEAMIALDDSNFEKLAIVTEKPILVQFYASWCGPCHKAAPVLNEVAHRGARIGKLDCERSPETAKRFAVRSYPTLVLFDRGLRGVYRGPRTVEDIERWLKETIR